MTERGASSTVAASGPGPCRGTWVVASLVACLAIQSDPAEAQAAYAFETFSIERGLPQSQVAALAPSAHGYLRVGTMGGGLARFDGADFETFARAEGLPGNDIRALAEDTSERLWIGTDRGLSIFSERSFEKLRGIDAHAVLEDSRGEEP